LLAHVLDLYLGRAARAQRQRALREKSGRCEGQGETEDAGAPAQRGRTRRVRFVRGEGRGVSD
jgi:hypothetical protein